MRPRLTIETRGLRFDARMLDLSQSGTRIECRTPLALGQAIFVRADRLPVLRGHIRWRKPGEVGDCYGIALEDTLGMTALARLLAQLQAPDLLAATVTLP